VASEQSGVGAWLGEVRALQASGGGGRWALAWLGGPLLGLPRGREFGGQGRPAGALSGNDLLGGGGN
jgi:hypothetical protein